jgi:hypothetical protein
MVEYVAETGYIEKDNNVTVICAEGTQLTVHMTETEA